MSAFFVSTCFGKAGRALQNPGPFSDATYMIIRLDNILAADVWPNGKALDYESRDPRFDPWHVQICFSFWVFL